ncbi:hypothetical protein EVAR_2_1 [Eumeta japonica]|uniref:Uncharacterized protein n=1 Tax=Eumeta variegata TaxID=151549 RepID=A0A4C1S8L3_EUMVA|nr:hypothetical protein EVAR_2_1 [Eumeta japonica]
MLRLPTLSSVSTDPPANRNGLLKLRARAATHNKTRRRPVVATRRKLKYYRNCTSERFVEKSFERNEFATIFNIKLNEGPKKKVSLSGSTLFV